MLSQRASNYLQQKERVISTIERDAICEVFNNCSIPLFEPLIEFQQAFAGYVFYCGMVPVKIGLIRGEGGYPNTHKFAFVDFDKCPTANRKYRIDCTLTDTQVFGALDEQGSFYESNIILASSFAKLVEEMALCSYLETKNNYRMVQLVGGSDRVSEVVKKYGLYEVPEATDELFQWFSNDSIYLKQRKQEAYLLIENSSPLIKEFSSAILPWANMALPQAPFN